MALDTLYLWPHLNKIPVFCHANTILFPGTILEGQSFVAAHKVMETTTDPEITGCFALHHCWSFSQAPHQVTQK